jgi:hypothetical protein
LVSPWFAASDYSFALVSPYFPYILAMNTSVIKECIRLLNEIYLSII